MRMWAELYPGRRLFAVLVFLCALIGLGIAGSGVVTVHAQSTNAGEDNISRLALSKDEREWLSLHPHIRVGVDPDWQPFEFIDADGNYSGISADYLAQISGKTGIDLTPVPNLDWNQVIAGFRDGTIDVLPLVAKTNERKRYMRFTRSYISLPLVMICRRGAMVRNLEDLKGLNVGVIEGSIASKILRRDFPELNIVVLQTQQQGEELLHYSRIDAIVRSPEIGPRSTANSSSPGSAGMVVHTPFEMRLFIGVRKDWRKLTRILNKALGAIPQKRKMEIQGQWAAFEHRDHIELDLFFQILGAIGVVFLLIWGGVLIANRRLKKEIVERERAEVALAKNFKLTQVLSDELPDFVCVFDVDGRYMFVNKKFEKWLGLKGTDVIGKTVYDVYPEAEARHLDALNRRVLETRLVTSMEYSHTFPDGNFRHVKAKRFPIFSAEGTITAIGNINHDISDQKQSQKDLEAAKEQAEQANHAKSRFLSSMSHELRTPLNAILGFGQILQGADNLSEQQQQAVTYILDGGNHLLELITEVLDLSRIEAGNLALNIETMRPGKVWRDSLGMAEAMASKRNIKISTNFVAKELPYVLADRRRLKQVLLNFLSNAIKYNNEGGEVMVNFSRLGDSLCRFAIADTGDGIPLERQHELFTPFTRLADNFANIEGTGIGLIITRELVRLMGGDVGFSSVPGEGSIFWFDLPLASAETSSVTDKTTTRDTGDEQALEIPSGAILYIEDNDANRQLMDLILAQVEGIRFLAATSVKEGLEVAEKEGPDLILMDINLPDMGGFEALEIIRNHPKLADTPVVAVSANAMEHDIRAAQEAGFDRYITKPFTIQEVHEVAADMLSQDKKARKPAPTKQQQPTATPPPAPPPSPLDVQESAAAAPAPGSGGNGKATEPQESEPQAAPAASPARANSNELDAKAVTRLRQSVKQLPPEFLNILNRQLDAVPEYIDGLQQALEGGDARKIEILAHKMKGNCANFGASALTDKAQTIENLAVEGKIPEVSPHIAELSESFVAAKPAIRALLDELASENS